MWGKGESSGMLRIDEQNCYEQNTRFLQSESVQHRSLFVIGLSWELMEGMNMR